MGGKSALFTSTSLHGLEVGSIEGSSGGGGVFSWDSGGRMGDVPLDCFGNDLALLLLEDPRSRRGSSVGEGGGIAALRSISGGSSLICSLSCLPVFFLGCRGFFFCALEGWTMISRGGVKRSVGGSYGGIGVIDRLFLAVRTCRAYESSGGM